MKTKEIQIPAGWFTREGMAAVLDVSPQHFDRTYRPMILTIDQQTIDRRPLFRARGLIDVLAARAARENDPAATDAMLVVGDSPALERYRLARAGLAELELAEKSKELVSVRRFDESMQPALRAMRDCDMRLQKRFGVEAHEIYDEAVLDFLGRWEKALADLGNPSGAREAYAKTT